MKIDNLENLILNSMDIILKRHEVLANNIANMDTPGYIKKDIDIELEIKKLIKDEIYIKNDPEIKNFPEKKIKLENEILEISKNTLLFNSLVKILILRQKILESSINTGGI